jgi:hypothetical protein
VREVLLETDSFSSQQMRVTQRHQQDSIQMLGFVSPFLLDVDRAVL